MSQQLFSLPNLASNTITARALWDEALVRPTIPDVDVWQIDPTTNWAFVSGYEGMVPELRVCHANPACRMHALVVDYDAKNTKAKVFDPSVVKAKCEAATFRPTMFHMTRSGGARVIWLFEAPIDLWSEFTQSFLKVVEAKLGIRGLLKGLDSGAFYDPAHYFDWSPVTVVSGVPIPSAQLIGWCQEASLTSLRKGEMMKDLGVTVEDLEKLIARQVEGGTWRHPLPPPTSLVPGTRCRRFWDADSKDETSAVVTAWGVHYFSDGGGGMTWTQLLGKDALQGISEESMGSATEGIYYESSKARYWVLKEENKRRVWSPYLADAMRRMLSLERGVSKDIPKGEENSRLDQVLYFVERSRVISGTLCEVFNPRELIFEDCDGGHAWLNTSSVKALTPDPRSKEEVELDPDFIWFMDTLLGKMFPLGWAGSDREPDFVRQHFLAWLRCYYQGAYRNDLSQGQAVYLVGEAGAGKSLLIRVISRLVGGHNAGAQVLTNATTFNAHLFTKALVTVDDELQATDVNRGVLVQALKALVANPDQSSHGKGLTPVQIKWKGRVMVSANSDAMSAKIIPDMRASVRDKVNLYLVSGDSKPDRITDAKLLAVSRMVGRWLLDTVDPACVVQDSRFGIASYQDSKLESRTTEERPEMELLHMLQSYVSESGLQQEGPLRTHAAKAFILLSQHYKDAPGVLRKWDVGRVAHALKVLEDTRPDLVVRTEHKTDGRATWDVTLTVAA